MGDNPTGDLLAWIAVISACFSILVTIWPLSMSVRAFRDAKYSSKLTITNYLNLISIALVFVLMVMFLVLEYMGFIQNDYYGLFQGYEITIVAGVVSILKTVAAYSFVLVILDRYRMFGRMIHYSKYTIPILHALGLACFLISVISYSWIFAVRMASYDKYPELPKWNMMKFAIQFYCVFLDLFVLMRIAWVFLIMLNKKTTELSPTSPIRSPPVIPVKTQILLILPLLVILDVGAITFGSVMNAVRNDVATVSQLIGETMFGIHIVLGLVVLLKLKTAVEEKSTSLAAQVPDIQLSTKKINVIALSEDGYEELGTEQSPTRGRFQ